MHIHIADSDVTDFCPDGTVHKTPGLSSRRAWRLSDMGHEVHVLMATCP